jgi:PadR family transcriptional regulator PadR
VAAQPSSTILQGTLDLLVLKALALEDRHGLGVARRVEQMTRGTYKVGPGSLFPALYRLETAGAVSSRWGVSENNRRAKYYHISAGGRRLLARETGEWKRIAATMTKALAEG